MKKLFLALIVSVFAVSAYAEDMPKADAATAPAKAEAVKHTAVPAAKKAKKMKKAAKADAAKAEAAKPAEAAAK